MESHDEEERDDPEREDIRLLQDDDTLEPTREQIKANEVKRLSPSAYHRNVVLCAVVFFFAELFELSLFAPTTALLERAICRAYYKTTSPDLIGSDGWVAEQLCRERPIQAELAVVKGWKAVFDCIPVFIVAAPLAKYARKIGPTKILIMGLLGLGMQIGWLVLICSNPDLFPVRLVWLSSVFLMCGGGTMQVAAMVHLLASRHAGKEHTGRAFYLINVAYMIDELVAPAVVSVTMDTAAWIPFAFAASCLLASGSVTCMLPDCSTLADPEPTRQSDHPIDSLVTSNAAAKRFQGLSSILKHKTVRICIPIFFVGMFRMAIISIMMQYPRTRFGWKTSDITTLFTGTALLNLIIFLGILPPWLTRLRTKYATPDMDIQVGLVRYSLVATGLGCLLIGLAPSSILLCIGTALFAISQITRPPLLACATVSVPESTREDLYGLTQIVENTTLLVAEPVLQALLKASLSSSGAWHGLPFYFAFMLYGFAATFSLFMVD